MLSAYFVPRSHDSALEERECILDRVGMNLSLNVSFFVANLPMLTGNLTLNTCFCQVNNRPSRSRRAPF